MLKVRPGVFSILLLLLGVCLSGGVADAEPADELDLTELTIEELMDVEVVYAASKFAQKSSEAPAAVTIVTAEEIHLYGYRTLADVLNSVRGFYTSYDRNYRYAGVRGFSRPGDYNTRILLLVDGMRANDNLYHSAYIGSTLPVDLDLVERIEIIRGPGSSLYGTNAFFGVINIVTKSGADLEGFRVSAEAGSFDTYAGGVTWGRTFPSGLQFLASGTYYDSDGPDLYYQEFDEPGFNNGLVEGGDWDDTRKLFMNLRYGSLSVEGAYSYRDKGIPTAAWGIHFNDNRNSSRDQWGFIAFGYDQDYSETLGVNCRLVYDRYVYKGQYVWDWADPGDPPDLVVNKDYNNGERVTGEVRLNWRLWRRHLLTLGMETRYDLQIYQNNYDEAPYYNYFEDDRNSTIWAVFAQDNIDVNEDITLNVGLRYDRYETFGSTVNPRVAMIFHLVSGTNLKVIRNSAFRAPNAYELYYSDGEETQKSNPDLEPETITTYEVELEQYIGSHFLGTVNFFDYEVKDLITQVTDMEDGLLEFRNLESANSHGIEFQLEGFTHAGHKGRLSCVYQVTEDAYGTQLTNSPEYIVQFQGLLALMKQRLFAGITTRYLAERFAAWGNRTEAYTVTDLNIYGKNFFHGLEISVGVYNLFNESYSDPGSEEHEQSVITQDGRTFRIKISYGF